MKVAIVCDDLIQRGGAEKVVMALSEMYPGAPIYTSYVTKKWKNFFKERGIEVVSSFMQGLPFADKLYRAYSVFLFHVFAFESFDLSRFDLVISSSSRYAHFVITKPGTTHVCYMHSPGRMLWEPHTYFYKEPLVKSVITLPLNILRLMDFCAAGRVDHYICNSKISLLRLKKYYKRDGSVVHPFHNLVYSQIDSKNFNFDDRKFFIVVTRLASWKKVEIAVKACEELKLRLIVIGGGPDLPRLKRLGGKHTEFLGPAGDEIMLPLLKQAEALIVTQKEDFGIVPLESMSLGTPVIAFGEGGVTESVLPGVTGEFYKSQTPESLKEVLINFDRQKYKKEACIQKASCYTKEVFVQNFQKAVDSVYLKN